MSTLVDIKVPDIGDFKEVEVIEVLVAEGDTIKAEQSLITVESDKASMEIPATAGGVVKSVQVKVGDKIAEGSVILQLAAEAASADGDKAGASTDGKQSASAGDKQSAPAGDKQSASADKAQAASAADKTSAAD